MSNDTELSALQLDVSELTPEEAVAQLIEHAAGLQASDLFFAANET
jgi:hypothetical protein